MCYQNQRRLLLGSVFSHSYLLPLDRWAWSDATGREERNPDSVPCRVLWRWTDDWAVDRSLQPSDGDGWQYASNFRRSWSSQFKTGHFVRRRRWVRTRQYTGEVTTNIETAATAVVKGNALKPLSMKERVGRAHGPSHYVPGDGTRLLFGWMTRTVKGAVGASSASKSASVSSLRSSGGDERDGELFQEEEEEDFVNIDVDEQTNLAFMAAVTQLPDMSSTLTSQGGLCPDCGHPIPLIDPNDQYQCARRCMYSGRWYCHGCHGNDRHVIPAMILQLGDFAPQPVCNSAKSALSIHSTDPILVPALFHPPAPDNEPFRRLQEVGCCAAPRRA